MNYNYKGLKVRLRSLQSFYRAKYYETKGCILNYELTKAYRCRSSKS